MEDLLGKACAEDKVAQGPIAVQALCIDVEPSVHPGSKDFGGAGAGDERRTYPAAAEIDTLQYKVLIHLASVEEAARAEESSGSQGPQENGRRGALDACGGSLRRFARP
jgi:hypothetical protein